MILRDEVPRVFEPLVQRRYRYRGLSGGRGSGKSHFVAEDLVLEAVGGHARILCGREIQNSIADSSKQLIEDKIRKLGLERYFKITEREIVAPLTDSLMIFKGLQAHTTSSVKSLEGYTDFWGEEAQSISQHSIDLITPTFRTGSQMTFTWNHISPEDPVEKLFAENGIKPNEPSPDDDFIWVKANFDVNPWFPDELRRDMERDRRRDLGKYLHVWLGDYRKMSQSRVFDNFRIEAFETPKDARFYLGGDWGFSIDPTVLIRLFIVGDRLYIDREVYQVGLEIDNTPEAFDRLDPGQPMMARKWPMVADSARPETISYMKRNGYPRIQASVKGKGSVEDGIEFLKSFDIYIHPRCKNAAREFLQYSWKVDKKTDQVLPVLEDDNNHVIDAARYALEATRRSHYTLANIG
jgi:phage terminase large subunit